MRVTKAAAKNTDSGSFDFDVPFGAVAADVSKLEPGARDVRRCRCCNDHAEKVHPLDEIHTGKVIELTPLEICKDKRCTFGKRSLFELQICSNETECTTGTLGQVAALSGIPKLRN